MDKAKIKRLVIKTGTDAAGILLCSAAANMAPQAIPALEGMEMALAVAAGIWLYIPLRGYLDKALAKIKK